MDDAAKPLIIALMLFPHGCSLRVASCPPRGPLRLRSGEANPAAPACREFAFDGYVRVICCF